MTPQEQIKEKLDIADLIGGYIQLKPAGSGSLKGLCPFHGEKTPSFHVSRERQFWHCFGCNQGGDHFTFIQQMEGVDFGEALRMLAERTGVEIPRYSTKEGNEKTRLFEAVKLAERFFRAHLLESKNAEHARAYVKKRVISDELSEKFGIGYAPQSWDALTGALKKRGFNEDELLRAGLVAKSEKGKGVYDRFRDRLMFPIRDAGGRTVGFTGRILSGNEKEAKYVNTPQSSLYDKSAVLYGLDLAKPAIREKSFVVIVEGQMDVIGSWRGEVKNVVASSGTALTERQVAMLRRYTSSVHLAFDSDAAGLNAARRGIDLLLAAEADVRIITLPDGYKDPDECTVKDPAIWQNAVSSAKHIVDFDIQLAKKSNLNDPTIKKKALGVVLETVAKLKNAIERDEWLKIVSKEFSVAEQSLKATLKPTATVAPTQKTPEPSLEPAGDGLDDGAIAGLLGSEDERKFMISSIKPEMLEGVHRSLYKRLLDAYTTQPLDASGIATTNLAPSALYQTLQQDSAWTEDWRKILARATFVAEEAMASADRKSYLVRIVSRVKDRFKNKLQADFESRIRDAEAGGNSSEALKLLQEWQSVLKSI